MHVFLVSLLMIFRLFEHRVYIHIVRNNVVSPTKNYRLNGHRKSQHPAIHLDNPDELNLLEYVSNFLLRFWRRLQWQRLANL